MHPLLSLTRPASHDFVVQPAVQLLAFFRSVGKDQGVTLDFSTTEICRLSPSVRDLERLDEAYPRRWIEYWQGKHFLS